MKKVFCTALLGVLSGCAQHGPTGQSIKVDAKTHLAVYVVGAALQGTVVPRTSPDEPFHRVISNSDGKVLFAYDLEVGKGAEDGMYSFRLKPSKQKPTFAAAREVTVKSQQESVRVDLMENPDTGEKVSDVLRFEEAMVHEKKLMSPMDHLMEMHNRVFRYFHGH